MATSVTIKGLSATLAAFRRIPGETRTQVQKHAVTPTARAVLSAARSGVPVDTGELKASLSMRVAKAGRANVDTHGPYQSPSS